MPAIKAFLPAWSNNLNLLAICVYESDLCDNASIFQCRRTCEINGETISVSRSGHCASLAAADSDGTLRRKCSSLAGASDRHSPGHVSPGDMGRAHGTDDSLCAADSLGRHVAVVILASTTEF